MCVDDKKKITGNMCITLKQIFIEFFFCVNLVFEVCISLVGKNRNYKSININIYFFVALFFAYKKLQGIVFGIPISRQPGSSRHHGPPRISTVVSTFSYTSTSEGFDGISFVYLLLLYCNSISFAVIIQTPRRMITVE